MLKRKQRRILKLVDSENFNLSESYKMLRANLEYSLTEDKKVILITSSVPYEGKSTVAANLSVFLSDIGYKVLLLECDLRTPQLHKFFNISKLNGLTNIIVKNADINSTIIEINSNLHILCSGPTPPNPAELLGSKKMKYVVDALSNQYDYILMDTPPASSLSDAVVLSPLATGIVLVIKYDSTPVELIKHTIDNFKNVNAKIIGTILSQVDTKKLGMYNKYNYNNSYKEVRSNIKKQKSRRQRIQR